MPELLTYPWDSQYPKNNLDQFFGATAEEPNMPTDVIAETGFGTVTDGGYTWKHNSNKPYGSAERVYSREWSNNSIARGFGYRIESTNAIDYDAWFDVGAGANLSSGQVLPTTAKSSYMKNVTACWFVSSSNASSDNSTANTRYKISQVGIRYINRSSRRLTILTCPNVLAGLTYGYEHAGGNPPSINGYELSNSDKTTVKNDGLFLVGFRIAIYYGKDRSTRQLTTQVGINALTPGFVDSTKTYNIDNKRIICRNSQKTYDDLYNNAHHFPIECR